MFWIPLILVGAWVTDKVFSTRRALRNRKERMNPRAKFSLQNDPRENQIYLSEYEVQDIENEQNITRSFNPLWLALLLLL